MLKIISTLKSKIDRYANNKRIIRAASISDITSISDSIKGGADINAKNASGRTPLHLALVNENEKCLRYLLANHADTNPQDHFGLTALHLAVCRNSHRGVKALIDASADISIRDKIGRSPLDIALIYNKLSIFTFITVCIEEKRLNDLIKSQSAETPIAF